jgi:hypothetical protein
LETLEHHKRFQERNKKLHLNTIVLLHQVQIHLYLFKLLKMSRYAESHKIPNLRGPGDARPTALQVIEDEGIVGKLNDKVFLVTGVSSGIGIDTMRALHATGAHVFGTVRDMTKGQQVVDQILSEKHSNGGKLTLMEISLDSLDSVRKGAQNFLFKSGGKLNVLIGNAGIMATPYGKTDGGFEQQFATKHLGHFLLLHIHKKTMRETATPDFPSRNAIATEDSLRINCTGHEVLMTWAAFGFLCILINSLQCVSRVFSGTEGQVIPVRLNLLI